MGNVRHYIVEIEKGGYLSAEPHAQETYEFITVFEGEITIRVSKASKLYIQIKRL